MGAVKRAWANVKCPNEDCLSHRDVPQLYRVKVPHGTPFYKRLYCKTNIPIKWTKTMNLKDETIPLADRVRHVGAMLRQQWGRNPQSDLLEEAANALQEQGNTEADTLDQSKEDAATETATTEKPRRASKGKTS